MKQNIFKCIWIFISFSFFYVKEVRSQEAKKVDSSISKEAKNYFDEAFKLIKSGSYLKNQLDFDRLYDEASIYIKGANEPKDTYEGIKFVLASLKDRHSTFIPPKSNILTPQKERVKVFPVKSQFFNKEYAVLELLSFSSLDVAQHKKIADSIYNFILMFKKSGIKNLIIDLRNMEGGSNDPFLCGLAPLINQTTLFTYVGNNNQKEKMTFENGRLYRIKGRAKFGNIYLNNYVKDKALSSIAISILTGPYTASAGEIIAISFKGLSNVRYVGSPTYGIPTGVALVTLKDGARIGIASSVPVDRSGKPYYSSLIPDIPLETNNLSNEEIYSAIYKIKR